MGAARDDIHFVTIGAAPGVRIQAEPSVVDIVKTGGIAAKGGTMSPFDGADPEARMW